MTDIDPTGTDQISAALVAFQAEMPTVPKNKTARIPGRDGRQGYSYDYADLADVSAAATPLLVKHGLAFSCCPRHTDQGYELAGVLLHSSGQKLEGSLPLHGRQAQEIGSSITYARRYLLGCMTGLVTDEDDDGTAAQVTTQRVEAPMSAKTQGQLFALFNQKGILEEDQLPGINHITGKTYDHRGDLTERDAQQVIAALRQRPDAAAVGAPA